ncbi:hypothetical protein [Brevibacillus laterosporus]|uniref:hypothetical protein n=1 Tax=Brevibacillus laterosporus TaxID=1465 RepID=UPI0026536C21|nr:hypothetical protein [Brevibacillus laterosporus]MDN9012655.1 hypothetical protein [Brevibacillus laterosporus]MDO0943722.1 hypothetical protein [Brevibacillus laterosporus]
MWKDVYKLLENITVDQLFLNTDNWPTVLIDYLNDKDREKYLNRKQAVDLYMKSECTIQEIVYKTGIHKNYLEKFVKSCLSSEIMGEYGVTVLLFLEKELKYTHVKNRSHKAQN